MSRRKRSFAGIAGLMFLSIAMPVNSLSGQINSAPEEPFRPLPGWVGDFTVLGVNAVLGGIIGGVGQQVRGGSFANGFSQGFMGGAVLYAGKRLAAERFAGAGAVGRVVSASGGSIIRNASENRPPLDHWIVPVGPVRLYVDRDRIREPELRLDLNMMVTTIFGIANSKLDLDFRRSLSAGVPVFVTDEYLFGTTSDTTRASGQVVENVIFLSDLEWRPERERAKIFAHERIHVLQRDQVFATIADPLGQAVLDRLPRGATIRKYVDVHVTDLIFNGVGVLFDYYDRPWEMEAYYLSDTGPRR